MKIKKHLSFAVLIKVFSTILEKIQDYRQKGKIKYNIHNVFMSAFAMMFFQEPSMLQFQRNLEKRCRKNNLRTLFKVDTIPDDSQMRNVLDNVDNQAIAPVFNAYFNSLQRGKYLNLYRFLDGFYLIPMDGSEYFSSGKVCCPGCLRREHKKGETTYTHQIMQAAVMHPDMRQVIPLMPEEIRNTDGVNKQDCEIEAGKRLVTSIRKAHPVLKIIVVSDSLHSKQPFIEHLEANGMSYILVSKEGDHKIMMEWVREQRLLNEVSRLEVRDFSGRRHVYEWINQVPLNGNENTVWVNYFEYWLKDNDKITYHSSWVTDKVINDKNIEKLVKGGRCRWKIENETFNTLKNQGYHIEHNYGHGKKHLSMNFFLLNLLAFFLHQIFELSDILYQECRKDFGSKRNLWDHMRTLINTIIYPDWETFLSYLLKPPEVYAVSVLSS